MFDHAYLGEVKGEIRLDETALAKLLDLPQQRLYELIKANHVLLSHFGAIRTSEEMNYHSVPEGDDEARPIYWVNLKQALFLCNASGQPSAPSVAAELGVEVFQYMARRKTFEQLAPSRSPYAFETAVSEITGQNHQRLWSVNALVEPSVAAQMFDMYLRMEKGAAVPEQGVLTTAGSIEAVAV